MLPRSLIGLVVAGALASTAAGCSVAPTYPKDRFGQALQDILTQQDQLQASVRVVDHTVAVQIAYPDALAQHDGVLGIGEGFDDVARKVITALHRVLLSTDAEVRFYVLLLSDPKVPGAYLTMVRYMDDIKRANANMIDTPEMFARTIFELNFVGPQTITLEQYVPRDIQLEEFLSWQLARRIQSKLTEKLEISGLALVGRCGGNYENGEFAFTLDVSSKADAKLDDEMLRRVFRDATNEVAKVLSSYRFESFNSVRLIHPPTGRNFVLPKSHLKIFL